MTLMEIVNATTNGAALAILGLAAHRVEVSVRAVNGCLVGLQAVLGSQGRSRSLPSSILRRGPRPAPKSKARRRKGK